MCLVGKPLAGGAIMHRRSSSILEPSTSATKVVVPERKIVSAVMVFVVLVALVAVFVKAVQMSVSGMPAWQAAHHVPASRVKAVLR